VVFVDVNSLALQLKRILSTIIEKRNPMRHGPDVMTMGVFDVLQDSLSLFLSHVSDE